MMGSLSKDMGAGGAAPNAAALKSSSSTIYPLPPAYRKPIRFLSDGLIIMLGGRRALVLDLLIAAKPAGIDRSSTLQWVANLSDTVCALRVRGIVIETRKGQAANYVLISDVRRIGGAQ
jgi:hypothetical protein